MGKADAMRGKWGLFAHYLNSLQNNPAMPNSLGRGTSWEACVEELDVEKLAEQVASTGASWFGLSMHQQSEHICAPNAVYEQETGLARGTATTFRDLPTDLGLALRRRGVELMLYHTGEGPVLNKQAGDALGGIVKAQPINDTYFDNWLECLREDARRHADVVRYWWIDGCYPAFAYTPERLLRVAAVFHEECPNAAVALNYYGCGNNIHDCEDGVIRGDWFIDPAPAVPGEDYSAGETNLLGGLPDGWSVPQNDIVPLQPGAQWHVLTFLGKPADPRKVYEGWGAPGCKYAADWLKQYRSELTARGGALTLDCCVRRDGTIDPEQLQLLRSIAE